MIDTMKTQRTMKGPARVLALTLAGLTMVSTGMLTGCGKKQGAGGDEGGGGGKQGRRKPGVGDPGGSIPVQVASVQLGSIQQTVAVTGNIQALQDVQLAAKANGRVTSVAVREGDPVRAGQVVVQQDATDLIANVQQAQANVLAAEANVRSQEAKVSQAQTNYRIAQIQAQQGVAQARAAVSAAQQNALKLRGGSRPQQVLQAQAQVDQARANLQNAQTVLNRDKTLFAQGAIAKAEVDTAQTNYDVLVQQVKNAQANLSLVKTGYQQEDIAQAQAQVRQQQAGLQTAIGNQRTVALRRDDILAAQAAVRQAKAQVAQARATLSFNQQQVANASIRSPINGIVAARETEPGQIASPGTALLRIVNVKTVYYEPTISETDFAQTTVGDPVTVQADALPGKTFTGRVVRVYPAASSGGRVFSLRVSVFNPTNELRPGMFARGGIVTREARHVPIVPATALVTVASAQGFEANTSSTGVIGSGTETPPQQVVVVGPNNTAQLRPVRVGIATMQKAQITSGLNGGERIVVVGQRSLKNGDKLAILNGSGAPGDGTTQTAQAF